MKKLLVKIFVLFLLIFVPLGIVILLPSSQNDYMQGINDKHQRLTETVSPRMVLVGGSNLAFGIDSAAIEAVLHIPVVNSGISVGIGLGRMLDDIAPFLHAGDILVIVPEYSHFISQWNGTSTAYGLIFDTHKYPLIAHLPFYGPPSDFITYIKNKVLSRIPHPPNPLAYSRDGFNKYGDYVKHLDVENQPIKPVQALKPINKTYLDSFSRFVELFTEKNVTVLLSYPSYETESFHRSSAIIHELDAVFRSNKSITVISSPDDYCFPTDFFYDTTYHLNAKGRRIRTSQLIQDLTRWSQSVQ
jgi:hypothetical protein